ncbi:MAG: ABC transporter ATP-binding protein [Oligoflexia bacterium]|nr:ABC transporter ATP-binding protein [Oligoflexia bacterium]
MIKMQNVSVSFSQNDELLCNVNLAVRRGETFVVIGPSGEGKSVLIKTVAGLITPQTGQVLLDGNDLQKVSRTQRAQITQRMGMLFQKNALFDSFTVGDNLAFPLRETTKLNESEIQEKVKKFLEAVGLSSSIDLYPDEISGGMQKRVGIARALILNPEIILYDDPTAGLDPITSKLIIELIIKLNKEFGTTVIAITNDMNRAFQMADRIGILLDKTLFITGTVEETKHHKNPRVQKFIRGELDEPSGLGVVHGA